MKLTGVLKKITKSDLVIRLTDGVNLQQLSRYANRKEPVVELDVADGRMISPDQRRKAYALIRDISEYTGYTREEAPAVMKTEYLIDTGENYFSLSDCSVETARLYISWLLDFCFEHDVPFATKTWDMIPSDYPLIMRCLKHRKCCICGKPADIDHVDGVQMGNNRKRIDNRGRYFLPLCRIHHTQRHAIGLATFMNMYHIKPVKPDDATIKTLKLNTQAQFDKFDS